MLHARSKTSKNRKRTTSTPIVVGWAEAHKRAATARSEADLIASALAGKPALDREGMGTSLYPFNEIASSDAVIAVVERLVRSRIPDNPWNDAHRALMRTDQNGVGYAAFTDVFRDAGFQVGVDYALRSLPSWWFAFRKLDRTTQESIALLIEQAAPAVAKGGAR